MCVCCLAVDVTNNHNVLLYAAAGENHSDRDCFGAAVLSHGDADVLYGTDGIIAIDNFVAPIKSCKTLVGKPKLFIFQVKIVEIFRHLLLFVLMCRSILSDKSNL